MARFRYIRPLFIRFTGWKFNQPRLKQIWKKNVVKLERDISTKGKSSNEHLPRALKSRLSTLFHHKLPDLYRFKQRLRNRCHDMMDNLTSFLLSLLVVPKRKSAEIRIHVKQDADRRIPPGRNPGSGGARK